MHTTSAAWAVHLFTASGAVWGLLALDAVARSDWRMAFVWMTVAMVVDSFDGMLARAADVERAIPWFDGTLLDNLLDYLTYVVVPAFFVYRAAVVPDAARLPAAAAILLAAAFQFCRADAKTDDHFFKGFPSFWNVTVFYMFFVGLPPVWNLALLGLLCAVSLSPLQWAYPSRMARLRGLTLTLTIAWGASIVAILARYPEPPTWLLVSSMAYLGYYAAVSLYLRR